MRAFLLMMLMACQVKLDVKTSVTSTPTGPTGPSTFVCPKDLPFDKCMEFVLKNIEITKEKK